MKKVENTSSEVTYRQKINTQKATPQTTTALGVRTNRNYMRSLFFLLFFIFSNYAKAAGFGWYLYVYDWQAVDRDVTSSLAEYKSLAGSNQLLINHFQQLIDSSITDICSDSGNNFEAYSLGLTPLKNEFYSRQAISYLISHDSSGLFRKFSNSSNSYLVGKSRETPTDPYVIFSPAEVIKALKVVKSVTKNKDLERSLSLQLSYMEAALMIAASERYEVDIQDDDNMGVIFCGRN